MCFVKFNTTERYMSLSHCSHSNFGRLINSFEKFNRNLHWKAHFFLNPQNKETTKETFGFKSISKAPKVPELNDFEDSMIDLIKTVEFEY